MKTMLKTLTLITILTGWLLAELPVSVALEGKGGYVPQNRTGYGEFKINIDKEFDVVPNMTIGLENIAAWAQPDFSDELGIDIRLNVTEYLTFTVGPKFFIEKGLTVGIHAQIIPGYESEEKQFLIENESDFLYLPASKSFEYGNKLVIEKLFKVSKKLSLGIGFENELSVAGGELSEGFLVGPVFTFEKITLFVNYGLLVLPAVEHGAELGFVFEF